MAINKTHVIANRYVRSGEAPPRRTIEYSALANKVIVRLWRSFAHFVRSQ